MFLKKKKKKTVYLFDSFLGGFFLKPKLNKSVPCFLFEIYFKINLVLSLGFKVINVKNLHSKNLKRKFKYCNVNIFNLLTSEIAEFPTSNFIFAISLQKKIEPHAFVLCILQVISQDLATACTISIGERSMH